jgi:hypothetical protein
MKDTKIKPNLTLHANTRSAVSEVHCWINELLKRELYVRTQDYDLSAPWYQTCY